MTTDMLMVDDGPVDALVHQFGTISRMAENVHQD